jgi:uncharacterized membrane protein
MESSLKKTITFKSILLVFIVGLFCFLGLPFLSFAQSLTYQPLVGIPGVNNTATDFNLYINQLYFLSISLAALLAVIKIIIGGVKWMLTDVVTSKSDAKNDIRSALLGLLLIVSAVLILGTINPQLRQLNVLGGAPALNPLPGGGARQQQAELPNVPQQVAPISEVRNADGTVSRFVSFDPTTVSGGRTQVVTVNGTSQTLPVVDSLAWQRYQSQQEQLRSVTCQTNGTPGRIRSVGDPQLVLIATGNRVNASPQPSYARYECI